MKAQDDERGKGKSNEGFSFFIYIDIPERTKCYLCFFSVLNHSSCDAQANKQIYEKGRNIRATRSVAFLLMKVMKHGVVWGISSTRYLQ